MCTLQSPIFTLDQEFDCNIKVKVKVKNKQNHAVVTIKIINKSYSLSG